MNTIRRSRPGCSRIAIVVLVVLGAGVAVAPRPAHGQTAGQQPTAIGVAVPASVELGQSVPLQARLVGPSGVPIPQATVAFTSSATFLHTSGDVVVAEATTDDQGLAVAEFEARRGGATTVTAVFAGNGTYAPAKAGAQLTVTGSQQLYQQEAGVAIPGLNAAPGQGSTVGGWPRWSLSGWPIAAVLLVVWSLYATAVLFMARIAALAGGPAGAEQPAEWEAER